MEQHDFIKAGFQVHGDNANENPLLRFLKEHYPNVIRDTELNLEELKAALGLPIDEKVNGYGLNFVGRNVARAKYAQKTDRELRLNTTLSKDIDTTQNLLLKGDNLDSLKILKSHYSGKIKCIYIDPPYNTTSDEFVYPDKFDKEEAEVLGLANLSDSDFARMDFSFKTKKSHNGWLAFMYTRLLLARDLLRNDGVIFISIDDNEQANLKLLCDDVFGEENFVSSIIWKSRQIVDSRTQNGVSNDHEYILVYGRNNAGLRGKKSAIDKYKNPDNDERGAWMSNSILGLATASQRPNLHYDITNPDTGISYSPPTETGWRYSKDTMNNKIKDRRIVFPTKEDGRPREKKFLSELESEFTGFSSVISADLGYTLNGTRELRDILQGNYFPFPKPLLLIKTLIEQGLTDGLNDDAIILDFFAGSGTTGHAVMQLNAEDGGNRKFILCQIDEPIDSTRKKDAYDFCLENNLPPVISSITIERLKRAAAKIAGEIAAENTKTGLFDEHKKPMPDLGFKVFDSADAPSLKVDEKGQIALTENDTDALSRIYNMIFQVGLDEPTQVPREVVKDSIYNVGSNYYITNSEQITRDDYATTIKAATAASGHVFIDGWTATLNGTLQSYKDDVRIVF